MAIVVDAARDANNPVLCANEVYQNGNDNANTPTPTWDNDIIFVQSVVDPHIDETTPPVPTVTNPEFVEFGAFWIDSVPGTVRFS